MKIEPKKKTSSLPGYLIFFVTVSCVVTAALTIFVAVNRLTEGNSGVIAVSMLIVIIAVSAVYTLIDIIRRRIMIDRPVRKILAATQRIAEGDFSVRLTATHSYERYDDYDLIMENLNVMAAELGRSEMLKSDFISNVSHELKTPLAIIKSYVTLMQSDELDRETRKGYAKTVLDATERLSNLVTNILKLNKLENQALSLETEEVRLDGMLEESILHFEGQIEKKELELECELDEVCIVSAPTYLEIVWNNLLSNAIKFTEKGGRITVSLKKEGERAVVRISDTGCGISPEVGAHIFEKFYQGDTSHSHEGNGLGLAMVKKVIELLGGEISVSSEVGKGSTFTIALKSLG